MANRLSNDMILADAYRLGSTSYQQNAPDPSQSTTSESIQFLFNPAHKRFLNEFVDYLFNVFGTTFTRVRSYESPWRRFEREWSYGDKALEYNLNLLAGHAYKDDWDADDVHNLLKVYRPTGESVIHEINYADTFPVSYNDAELRRAFDSEYGLNDYIAAVTTLPTTSAEVADLYRVINLFSEFEVYHGFYKVQLSAAPTTKEAGEELAVQIQTIAGNLRFPSSQYNARDVTTPTWIGDDNELLFITTSNVAANLNVKTLANLYHDSRAEISFDTIIVPELWIPGAIGILISRDWLVKWRQTYEMTSWRNPQNLTTTTWLHSIGCISASPFAPGVLFTLAEGTVNPQVIQTATSFELTPATATVKAGETLQLTTKLNGTIADTPEGSAAELGLDTVVPTTAAVFALTYTPVDDDDDYQLDMKTYVDRFNVLHVSKDVPAGGVIGITAKSTYVNPDMQTPPNLVDTATITVSA